MYNKRLRVYKQGGFKMPKVKPEEPDAFARGTCLINL